MVLGWIDTMLDRIGRSLPRFGSSPRNWRAREFARLRSKKSQTLGKNHHSKPDQGRKPQGWRSWFSGKGQSVDQTVRRAQRGRLGSKNQFPARPHGAAVQVVSQGHEQAHGPVPHQAPQQPPTQAYRSAHPDHMAFALAGSAVDLGQGTFASDARRSVRRDVARNPQRDRVFRRAKRHSIFVRGLRYGLPVMALGLLATLPLSAVTPTIPGLGSLSLDGIGFSGTTIVMENPRLNGFEQGRGGYQFQAERAEQDVTESNKVKLTGLNGRITQEDGRWASIRARQGMIDTDAETMFLERDIIVRAEGGYRAFLQSADVELKDGNVRSDKPVQVDMLNGSVKAQSLELIERGRYIKFDGDVKMTIYLGAVQEAGGNASASGSASSSEPQAVSGAAQ
jgi:lipopolysaccharide export system protein LptC